MTVHPTTSRLSSHPGDTLQNARVFRSLGPLHFNGQLTFTDLTKQQWIFYFAQGQILSASGGIHPGRRWRRSLLQHGLPVPLHRTAWQRELDQLQPAVLTAGWEYALLYSWIAQRRITPEQAIEVIRSIVTEALFDVEQAVGVTEQRQFHTLAFTPPLSLAVEDAIAATQVLWQAWQSTPFASYSPNTAPMIRQHTSLRHKLSAEFYQTLVSLLNSQHSLRDLAVKTRQDITSVTASLLPYLQSGEVELISIHDLPIATIATVEKSLLNLPPSSLAPTQGALIACVDDSQWVRKMMEELLTSAGYRFLGIDNALRAIGTLIAEKPDLIFLDLVMPQVNGHELCEQLRKLSGFRSTPIVILTGNDGYTNRLKSKIVGATDFISKPLNADAILSVIVKHLGQGVVR